MGLTYTFQGPGVGGVKMNLMVWVLLPNLKSCPSWGGKDIMLCWCYLVMTTWIMYSAIEFPYTPMYILFLIYDCL